MTSKFKFFLLFVLCFQILHAQQTDPVVITINGKPITKSEFEYTFHKNNSDNALDKKSLDEYVDMFVDYKLKVEEAKALGLDTVTTFVKEYNSYRSQLALPYLVNEEVKNQLAREAYERKKIETESSHILIGLPRQYYPKDTLVAYNKMMDIRNKIVIEGEDFNEMAAMYSEDPSAQKVTPAGHLGWMGALRFVDEFEHGMYQTGINEVSLPIRSQFGYHLIKVHNRRPNMGDVKVAHIMLAMHPAMSEVQRDSVKKIADDVYKQLQKGADFAELAKKYSTDVNSKEKGGELAWFASGQYPKPFEEAAFSLQNKGDYSKPISTAYGYHILQLIDKRPMASFEDSKESIMGSFLRGLRIKEVQQGEIDRILRTTNFAANNETYKKMAAITDSIFVGDPKFRQYYPNKEDILFTINGKDYRVADFYEYLNTDKYALYPLSTDDLKGKYNKFLLNLLKAEEIRTLEDNNPEFKNLSQEYYDGILLFELMNQEIWGKAQTDTIGLENYYAKNQKNYKWNQPKFSGAVILTANAQIKGQIENLLHLPTDSLYRKLEEMQEADKNFKIKIDKGSWSKGENTFVDFKAFDGDTYPATENSFPFYLVVGQVQSQPQLDDIRGEVINDYQQYLEKELMVKLRKKYPVKLNKRQLKRVK